MIVHEQCGRFGRLGNQMFQFAGAVGLANKHNTDWALINGMPSLDLPKLFKLTKTKYVNAGDVSHFNRYNERSFSFDPNLFNQPNNTSLQGYYQSEQYFQHCRDSILEEFSFKDEIHAKALIAKSTLGDKPLCSVHVRRGDYLNLQDYHPVQDFSYYDWAISELKLKHPEFNIVYFTDDPDWVGNNMVPRYGGTVSRANAYEDLCLMTLCDFNVVVNSSFSWWGAWLNTNPHKIVVAPNKRFGPRGPQTHSLYCQGWWIY